MIVLFSGWLIERTGYHAGFVGVAGVLLLYSPVKQLGKVGQIALQGGVTLADLLGPVLPGAAARR